MQKSSIISAIALLICASATSGCSEYLARHEGITSFAGESLAANEAVSVVDVWPDGFDDTDIPTDGKRQARAVHKYKNPMETVTSENSGQIQNITQ